MPVDSVEPMPPDFSELRLAAPDEAQDASYFAASERIASFSRVDRTAICSWYVLLAVLAITFDTAGDLGHDMLLASPGAVIERRSMTGETAIVTIEPIRPEDEPAVLALNNLHAAETSFLDAAKLHRLIGEAFVAGRIGSVEALLLAFDQRADYDSVNFLWFRERYARFVYVDRIITAAEARGRGHARRMYLALFVAARAAGHERVVCEVNSDPPNPASDAFHASMGFVEVGSATLDGGKSVRYFERRLDAMVRPANDVA